MLTTSDVKSCRGWQSLGCGDEPRLERVSGLCLVSGDHVQLVLCATIRFLCRTIFRFSCRSAFRASTKCGPDAALLSKICRCISDKSPISVGPDGLEPSRHSGASSFAGVQIPMTPIEESAGCPAWTTLQRFGRPFSQPLGGNRARPAGPPSPSPRYKIRRGRCGESRSNPKIRRALDPSAGNCYGPKRYGNLQ